MVESPIDPSRPTAASSYPLLMPALRHAGWLGFFLILAPAIGPHGYGVFMLALSGVALVEALLADTAAHALDGLEVLEPRHWSTALLTLMAVGAALSLVLSASAGWIGTLADEDGFGDMFRSLAVLPLLGALAVVPSVALRRAGRPIALVAAAAAGLAAGGGIAVSLAWAGAGPWSLVAQIVVQRLVECTVLWAIPGERIGLGWSRRHFADLAAAVDGRALAAAGLAALRHAPYLLVGVALGPSATGLYMLAQRLAEPLAELFFADGAATSARHAVERACRVALPAVLASGLLAIALAPAVEPRWWGAVLPGQILMLGALPAALIFVRGACGDRGADRLRWQAIHAMGGLAVIALTLSQGLVAIAAANVAWSAAVAVAGLPPLRRGLGTGWRAALAAAVRPCAGAAAAGALLLMTAGPVSLALAAVPALCLLTAAGWLLYLVVRGEPIGAVRPLAPRRVAHG